ncbi:hypothetical protein SUGI_0140290 [Cryptomeria japonica]|nr:hypothetical protein SUGI_0140290 [Cryptomeria japonica]
MIAGGQPLVKVKFVLQKKYKFGQQFAVVGDDPQFGTWNPKEALPLEWSEGDVWTIEVNCSYRVFLWVNRLSTSSFLKGKLGESSWQPGPNQVFDTLEDVPSMVVFSIWVSKPGNKKRATKKSRGLHQRNLWQPLKLMLGVKK